jgi:hypothetical protein
VGGLEVPESVWTVANFDWLAILDGIWGIQEEEEEEEEEECEGDDTVMGAGPAEGGGDSEGLFGLGAGTAEGGGDSEGLFGLAGVLANTQFLLRVGSEEETDGRVRDSLNGVSGFKW